MQQSHGNLSNPSPASPDVLVRGPAGSLYMLKYQILDCDAKQDMSRTLPLQCPDDTHQGPATRATTAGREQDIRTFRTSLPKVSMEALAREGISLRAENGRLIATGRLTDEHRQLIREHKEELLSLLTLHRVFRVTVAMPNGEPRTMTLISPPCSIIEAQHVAVGQFGADRVLAIQPEAA